MIGRDYVHLDIHNFEKGEELSEEIARNIDSSTIYVLLFSDEALNSDWVKKELAQIRLKLMDEEIADFLPFIIDEHVTIEDERLEQKEWKWLKKYLVKSILSPKMVARVVSRKLREQILKCEPSMKEREKLFFGRGKDMEELKLKLYENTSNEKRALIISGLDHVGRKRLIREFIVQNIKDVHDTYYPIKLVMTETDGIDRLVLQLNEYLQIYDNSILLDLLKNEKGIVDIAVKLLNNIIDCQERIFVRDEKCIVLGNGKLTDWFVTLMQRKDLNPQIHFFIASKFTPKPGVERRFPCIISRQIKALDALSMRALFNAYAKYRKISPSDDQAKLFLDSLSGFPMQAYGAVDLLAENDFHTAQKNLLQIVAMFDGQLVEIINELDKTPHVKDILVLFSMFEFVSYDLLAQVCPDDISIALEEFRKYSLYESFGSSNQYLRLNAGMADYISRNKMDIPISYHDKVREVTRTLLAEMDSSLTDLSSQLFAIKQLLRDKKAQAKAKERYLLPSFVLKVIVEEYNASHDDNVIDLVEMLLNDKVRNGYDELNRSIHYWYCCSLCRKRNRKFLAEVDFFKESQYSYCFLKGFYERHLGHNESARNYFEKALAQSSVAGDREYLSKAENELVIVKIELGDYSGAYQLAKKSFERDKSNTYHIESYFRCICHSPHPDSHLMKELIERMEASYVKNKEEIVPSMKAQYQYYVGNDWQGSLQAFEEIIRDEGNGIRRYARRALKEICEHRDSIQTYHSILRKLGRK